MSVTTRDTVREQAVVVIHDTIMETKTITITKNEVGDTTFMSIVTERDRLRDRAEVRDKEEKMVLQRDTVYIEKRDSVSTTNCTNYTNEKKSGFLSILKWTFAIAFLLLTSVALIRVWR